MMTAYGGYVVQQLLKDHATTRVVLAEKDNVQYVLKIIRRPNPENKNEVPILQDLVGVDGVVQYVEHFQLGGYFIIVYTFFPGGDLFDHLVANGAFEEDIALKIFRQLCQTVMDVHNRGIIHRDIKPENILIDNNYNVVLIDWGLAFYQATGEKIFCGSPNYASPEIVNRIPYDGPEIDVWSLGVVLYTLVTCKLPFDDDNYKVLVENITNCDVDLYVPGISDHVAAILNRIFVRQDRIGMQELLLML